MGKREVGENRGPHGLVELLLVGTPCRGAAI